MSKIGLLDVMIWFAKFYRLMSHKTPILTNSANYEVVFENFESLNLKKPQRSKPCNSIIFQNYNFKPDMLS